MLHHLLPRQPSHLRTLQQCGYRALSTSSTLLLSSPLSHRPLPPHSSFHSSASPFSPRSDSPISSLPYQPSRSLATDSSRPHPKLGETSPHDVGLLLAGASEGSVEKMKQALALGSCTVNDGDYDRRKPLHLAAADGRTAAVQFLLEQKAEVNAEDRWGNTALDEAVMARHDDIIKSHSAAHYTLHTAHYTRR